MLAPLLWLNPANSVQTIPILYKTISQQRADGYNDLDREDSHLQKLLLLFFVFQIC